MDDVTSRAMLRVVNDVINERLNVLHGLVGNLQQAELTREPSQLDRVATMLSNLTEAITQQCDLLGQLIQVITSQPPPVVKVPHNAIQVEVTQTPPPVPTRKPRTFTVQHSDGSKSTVKED